MIYGKEHKVNCKLQVRAEERYLDIYTSISLIYRVSQNIVTYRMLLAYLIFVIFYTGKIFGE